MTSEVVPAKSEHIIAIVSNIRPEDREELLALGKSPEATLHYALQVSARSWTGLVNGEPVCMFGVAPTSFLTSDLGIPWMVGTVHLEKHAILFLRQCKSHVDEMLQFFPCLENYVAQSNRKAIAWLRWLGFSFDSVPVLVGFRRVPFLKFTARRAS